MKIKICGLSRIEDIYYVNEAKPDFIGFIFAEKSRRRIDKELSGKLKSILDKEIKSVGVFVNQDISFITSIAYLNIIDLIQLHGNESNEYISELREKTNLPIIKALKGDENLKENIKNTNADFVLIDSFCNNNFGGTGIKFDWGLIPETNKKIFLAGGLNIENIKDAMDKINPYCLDINSGVETDGKKDKQKIKEIIRKIKGYNNE